MNLFYRTLFAYIIIQACICETFGANTCPDAPPAITGTDIFTIINNQTVVYKCTNNKEFSSGDSVIVSDCTSSGWYTVTAVCDQNHPNVEACIADEQVEEPENTKRITDDSFNNSLFRVYQCTERKEWLSGRPIRVMPCRNTEWMKIFDICDESCQIPRDCADVANLNLTDDGEYLVIPSGKSNGEIKTVHCFLDNTEWNHGGSWTLIFRNDLNTEMTHTKADYITGFGDPSNANTNYFIGLNFLSNISQNFDDRSIGNVMEVLFYESSDAVVPDYYVTYGNLTVGNESTGHALLSVGTHHGNAGDAFCEQVGTEFMYVGQETPYWWGVDNSNWENVKLREGNFLSSKIKWPPLDNEGIIIDHVIIRIRPYDFDREYFCPPMVGSHPSWKRTNASIPFNRTIGTEITWWCDGTLLYEGGEGGDRTKAGTLTCEEGPPPHWSRNITLPCTTVCPKGFGLLDDGLRCFLFSNTSAISFIDASLKCAEINSTLAVVNATTDPDGAADGQSYFVNHAKRGTEQTEVEFDIVSTGLNCTDENNKVCEAEEDNACAVITSEPSYDFQNCNSSMPYVCEIGIPDPVCPFGYKKYNFLCFSVIKEMKTFKEAYEACAKDGSSLAYPTNLALSITINKNIIKDFGLTTSDTHEFFLALNRRDGTWNKHEFEVKKDLEAKLDSDNEFLFRIFRLSPESKEGKYVPVDITYQSTEAKTHALCQYPGPIECAVKAPEAMEYMQAKPSNKTVIGTKIVYWCDEGYSVNKTSDYTVQNITCYSILGEWYPTLLPCEETPVCKGKLPTLGSKNTISKITNDSYYIGGNISYTCPPGLIFNDLRTEINLTCSKNGEEFSYNETKQLPPCNLCSGSFEHANSTSDYDSAKKYETGSFVNLECIMGFQFLSGVSSYEVECSASGWNTTGIEECVEMCTGEVNYGNASSIWNSTAYYEIGSKEELMCDEGYQYPRGENTQKINCTAWGWNTTGLDHCVKMCRGDLSYGHANSTWNGTSYYYIGSQHELQCDKGYQYLSGEMKKNVTCTSEGWNTTGVEECYEMCSGEISYGNASSTWDPTMYYYIGSQQQLNCSKGYQYESGETKQNITCSTNGWNTTGLEECVEMCSGEISYGNANSSWDPTMYYYIGSQQQLNCPKGYQYESGETKQNITCSTNGWNTTGLEKCVEMCTGEVHYGNAKSTWDSALFYPVGSQQELKCIKGYQYESGNTKQNITCSKNSWNTTHLEECFEMCTGSKSYGNANSTWDPTGYYAIGSQKEMQCYDDYQYLSGEIRQNITCSILGWNTTGLEECVKKCNGSLSYGNANSTWDSTRTYFIGETGQLECNYGYQYLSGKMKQNVTCEVGGWDISHLEECYEKCTGGKFFGNANYTWDPLSYYSIGEVQQLECIEGYQYLSGERNQNITCSVEGWNTTDLKKCVPMCKGELSYGNANLSSDPSIYYKIGETEDLVCDEAYQYLSGKENQTVTCTSEGWNTTDLDKCVKKCTGSVSYGNANSTWTSSSYYKIGFVGELKCNEDYQYLGGKKTQNITCTEKGWRTDGLDKCGEKCKGEVTYGNANSTWDASKSYEIGSVGELECFDGYQYLSGERKQNITCSVEGWDKTGLESCFKMCTGALQYGNANSTWKANDYYPIGDVQTIECNEGYQYLWNDIKQNVTCTKDGWDKSNLENCVEMCDSNVTLKQNIEPLSSTKKYYKIGEEAKVECKSGYEYAYEKTIQTIECTEEGWDLSSLQKCSRTCDDEPPPKGNHVAPLNITSRGVGDTISYKCQSGHFEPLNENESPPKEIFITCNEKGVWESPLGDKPLDCVVLCMDDPPEAPTNATRDWDGKSRTKDTEITYECDPGYYFGNLSATWTLSCDGTDWLPYDKDSFACNKVCKEDPPEVGDGVLPVDLTTRALGTILNYECEKGLYFEPSKENSDPVTKIAVKCIENGTWNSPLGKTDHKCVKLCVEDPPETPKNGTSNWNGKRLENTSITYDCDGDLLFGNFSSTWVVTCDGKKWLPYNEDIFYCSKTCNKEDLPKPGERQTNSVSESYATVGESVLYKCDNFTANKDGNKSYEITCQDTGTWDSPPKNFLCEDACDGPPVPAPDGVTYNFTGDFREGVVIEYVCKENEFQQYYTKKIYNQCSDKKWSKSVIPECVPSQNPTTPRDVENYESHYKDTADYYHSDISNEFEPASGEKDDFETVNGPLGFGDGICLESSLEQCMKKDNYIPATEKCLVSPNSCDDDDEGFSMSIWVSHDVHENTFSGPVEDVDDPNKYKYIISTGGDVKGHPGVAMALQGHFLIVILSTGDFYYKTRVLGQVPAEEWVNIGFVWYKKAEIVKVFVNLKEVAEANKKELGSKLLSLYPPELIVGCHKDNDNKTYRNFLDAKFDEVAFWMRPLSSDLNNYEVIAFYGGLDRNGTFDTKKNLEKMLENVNFKNPEQASAAMKYLQEAQSGVMATEASPTASTDTTESTEDISNMTDPESVEDLKTFIRQLRIIIDEDNVADSMDEAGLEDYLGPSSTLIDMIFGKSKIKIWKALQADSENKIDTYDAANLMHTYLQYQKKAVSNTLYPNGSKPFCVYSTFNQDFISVNCKLLLQEMKNKGKGYCQPLYRVPELEYPRQAWDSPYDRAKIHTSLYLDERCHDRPVSVTFNLFDKLPQFISLRVNPNQIDPKKMNMYSLDSRILIFEVNVDNARTVDGKIDTTQPLCKPDPYLLESEMIEVLLEHKTKMLSIKRKLLFHENENYTDILVRRCVRWKQNVQRKDGENLTGAWGPTGCELKVTGYESSQCFCDGFGTYSLLAEKTDPIYLEDPPDWLELVRYIIYGVSAGAIIIYIVVVIISGDLKDQLHLLGLNLALGLLLGSVAMIISDFEGVRKDRHMCVGVGTCIHFFYASVGISMFSLGHASFKAITAGIVDGRFKSYMYICWGAPLFLIGLPYVIYLHKLGRDPRCFIGWENEVKYIFFIPQAGCSAMALFWAIVILTNLSTPALRRKHLIRDYGSFSGGSAVLLIYLAATWSIGFVAYIRYDFDEPDFYPIFQIMNGLSGVILLLCIGISSPRFRRRMFCRSRKNEYEEYNDTNRLVENEVVMDPCEDDLQRTNFEPYDQNLGDDGWMK